MIHWKFCVNNTWNNTKSRIKRHRKTSGWWRPIAPVEFLICSFAGLIAAGTLALKFLPGIYQQASLNWTDAIFTSTSAVCVTGLIVVDTANYFTFWGQALILLLIQLGGLGMLVLTSAIIMAIGGRISLGTENLAAGGRQVRPQISARQLIVDIVRFTFLIEAAGALTLYCCWGPKLGWQAAIWPSVFHSISAFCNAGFSTNTDSLVSFQDSPLTILTISILIIAGGLGFIIIEELKEYYLKSRKSPRRFSLHTKLVLTTSFVLLMGGWGLFTILEWRGVLSGMSLIEKLTNSWFMSVTPRTAGFNTIDYAAAKDSSNLLTIILMMIGGSPGSTAGGMKTTTFALLGLLAWSRLRSQQTPSFARRSIPMETIHQATGLFVITTGIVFAGVILLTTVDDIHGTAQDFLGIVFESVSAFCTVGLSMGVTTDLTVEGRWIIIILMFVGRTGPLAIAAALVVRLPKTGRFRYAYEDVSLG